jgi:hypothetical protein
MSGATELLPPQHPEHAYIDPKSGYRNLDVEASVWERTDGAIVYRDVLDRNQPVAVVIELTAEGIEWLLDELESRHYGDRFVRVLGYARDLAKVVAWDRQVSA